MKVLFIIFLSFSLILKLSAQTSDTIQSGTHSAFEQSDSEFNLHTLAETQLELLTAKNVAEEQRTYKYIFLASMLFVLILSLFTFILFYGKTKKTTELLQLQNTEISLRENRIRQLSVLLDNVNSPILITRTNGEIQWLNRAFEEFYQITIKDLQEKSKSNFMTDISQPDEQTHIQTVLAGDKQAVSYPVASGKGTQFWRTVFALPGADGKAIGIGIIDNQTSRT